MQNGVRKLLVGFGTTAAAFALSIGPAAADSGQDQTGSDDVSDATQQAWDYWNQGGHKVTGGAAQMVSGAWVGVPHSLVDLIQNEGLSPETIEAWENWNQGGHKVGGGAAQMVSGAWIGVPHSVIDVLERAAEQDDAVELPTELPTE